MHAGLSALELSPLWYERQTSKTCGFTNEKMLVLLRNGNNSPGLFRPSNILFGQHPNRMSTNYARGRHDGNSRVSLARATSSIGSG